MVDAYFPSGNMEHLDLKENIEKLVKSGKTYEVIFKELKDQHLTVMVSLQDRCDVFVVIIGSIRSQ